MIKQKYQSEKREKFSIMMEMIEYLHIHTKVRILIVRRVHLVLKGSIFEQLKRTSWRSGQPLAYSVFESFEDNAAQE